MLQLLCLLVLLLFCLQLLLLLLCRDWGNVTWDLLCTEQAGKEAPAHNAAVTSHGPTSTKSCACMLPLRATRRTAAYSRRVTCTRSTCISAIIAPSCTVIRGPALCTIASNVLIGYASIISARAARHQPVQPFCGQAPSALAKTQGRSAMRLIGR